MSVVAPEAAAPRWPSPTATRPEVRYDVDDAYHDLYDAALAATQMKDRPMRRQRHYLIPQALRQVRHVPGAFAEIGCFRGLSAYLACRVLETLKRTEPFYIFDSFAGLSAPGQLDASASLPKPPKGAPNFFVCSEDEVRANLSDFPEVRTFEGWIPERFVEASDVRFSYVHVDVDLYQPTRDAIAFFWPRISPGGVMVLDDYGTLFYQGARRAADEVLSSCTDAFVVEATSGSAVVVKISA